MNESKKYGAFLAFEVRRFSPRIQTEKARWMSSGCLSRCGAFGPGNRSHGAYNEKPRRCACQGNECRKRERPLKVAGTIQNKSRQRRGNDPGKVSGAILQTCPAPCGVWACESLRDGPNVGRADAL